MSRPPDRTNQAKTIRVWVLPVPPEGTGPPDWQAGIRAWYVEAEPGVLDAVGFTAWYIGCVTLADLPGVPPAARHYPEAAYELSCWTINPEKHVTIDLYDERLKGRGLDDSGFLVTPPDIVFQWHGTDDAKALLIGESFVEAVLAGLSPSRPGRPPFSWVFDADWRRKLTATVEHFVTGHWPSMPEGRA